MNTINLQVVIDYATKSHREAISENERIIDGTLNGSRGTVRVFSLAHDNTDTSLYFQYSDENMYHDFIRNIDNDGTRDAAFYDDVTEILDMWIEELADVDVIIPPKELFWKMDTQ